MQRCREFENGVAENYSLFVHGYWLEWLNQQRLLGKIIKGKFTFAL